MKQGFVFNLKKISYSEALSIQEDLFNELIAFNLHKVSLKPVHKLLFCEHDHVYTLGKSGKSSNLLISDERLQQIGAERHYTNRGGDITYHGPGQIVGYPILNLEDLKIGIKEYMFKLEEVIIRSLSSFHITAGRIEGMTGVWLDTDQPLRSRKICAMGVKASRQVTMHGFALNVSTDLQYFDYIIPCGIEGKAVTSLQKELGRKIELSEVQQLIIENFREIMGINFVEQEKTMLKSQLKNNG